MYGERFDQALVWASQLHRHQTRKQTNIPYITHLLAVASLVGEAGGTEDEVIAALLHDAVEDQGGPPIAAEIRARFGDEVARVVEECTDGWGPNKAPWRERKEKTLAEAPRLSPPARLVMTADKLHNARSILAELRRVGKVVWARFTGGAEGTIWYYKGLAAALAGDQPTCLSRELARVVREIEQVAAMGTPDGGACDQFP